MGCKVAIDDFGAGYSSFKTLKHLPVDMVKIDGNFVRNLTTDKTDRIFLRTMAELAENFGMETVAEYVIDEPTAKIVEDTGITYLQGFHLGRPVMPSEILHKKLSLVYQKSARGHKRERKPAQRFSDSFSIRRCIASNSAFSASISLPGLVGFVACGSPDRAGFRRCRLVLGFPRGCPPVQHR